MDAFLERIGAQASNMVIRSAIGLTSTFALQQCSRLVVNVGNKGLHRELRDLQRLLSSKISVRFLCGDILMVKVLISDGQIVSRAIEVIEFKSGRGNVFLEDAVPLAKSLHWDIVSLGKRLERAATAEENSKPRRVPGIRRSADREAELQCIVQDIKALLERMDRDVTYLHLAITSSGESLSSTAPGISPSRLMQASALLVWGNSQFAFEPDRPAQIGPCFTLSLYMLFLGHASNSKGLPGAKHGSPDTPDDSSRATQDEEEPYGLGDGERKPLWQEVIHKARVRLVRTPLNCHFDQERGYHPEVGSQPGGTGGPAQRPTAASGVRPDEYYFYELEVVEDLNDGRAHDDDEVKGTAAFDGIAMAGIRESIPVHQISKIFYTDTGRILNIGASDDVDNNPILLLKRDCSAPPPVNRHEEWFGGPSSDHEGTIQGPYDSDSGREDSDDDDLENTSADDQNQIERQIREESEVLEHRGEPDKESNRWRFPKHLDPEWLALEVFMEDSDDNSSGYDEDSQDGDSESGTGRQLIITKIRMTKAFRPVKNRQSVDSRLIEQIRRISVQKTEIEKSEEAEFDDDTIVDRSPLGAITSSLSMLEMLIRLMHVQIVQQTTHLAVPDHITTFFLEETSTTGLQGEARWKARSEAKRHVGFDPYSDTLEK